MAVPAGNHVRISVTRATRIFFKRRQGFWVLLVVAWTRRELGRAQSLHLAADAALVQANAETVEQPGGQVLQPPSYDTVPLEVRSNLDGHRQRLRLRSVDLGARTRPLTLDQAVRTGYVQSQHPILDRLQLDRAGLGRLRAAAALVDRGQRQQPPVLARITARARQPY